MSETNKKPRTAFVTGGSGFVGGKLIRTLVSKGWEVRALARSQSAMAAVAALGATPVQGDMTDRSSLQMGVDESEVVFHVAAMFKLWGDHKEFDAVNVDGMRSLVDAASAARPVRKLVAVSAAAVVIGDPAPMINVDEKAPLQEAALHPTAPRRLRLRGSCSRRTIVDQLSRPLRFSRSKRRTRL